jgi:hypothetical protein
MSSLTTALLTVGPNATHPWGDRVWRVALSAQYVSGSSSDYWLVSPTQPAQYPVIDKAIVLQSPGHIEVLDSVIFLVALHAGDTQIEGYLLDHHNISMEEGARLSADFWELTDETRTYLAGYLSRYLRLGFTILEEVTPIDPAVVRDLRAMGFDVDVFSLSDTSIVT